MQDRDGTEPGRAGAHRRRGMLLALGAVAVAVAVAVAGAFAWRHAQVTPHAHEGQRQASAPALHVPRAGPADFGADFPSPDARLLANWVVATHDNGPHAFLLVDKKDARVYVFSPEGRLQDSAPVLLGAAQGDTIAPGEGDKPLSQMTEDDKITPSGRFVAEPGINADREDVIWVDYEDAISMHRVRPNVASERRLERLATPTPADNRISFGCINLPVTFYEDVARPAVTRHGGVVYVLPERKSLQEVFGAYDVTDPAQVAVARQRAVTVASHGGEAAG